MKNVLKLAAIVLSLATLFSLFSCSKPKKHELAELGIDLPDEFSDYNTDGAYDAAYSDGNMIVGMLRLSFADCTKNGVSINMSPYEWAGYYRERALKLDTAENMENLSEVMVRGDSYYFTYSILGEDGEYYFYMPAFYKSEYAYFVLTFIIPEKNKTEESVRIASYLDTVYITPYMGK